MSLFSFDFYHFKCIIHFYFIHFILFYYKFSVITFGNICITESQRFSLSMRHQCWGISGLDLDLMFVFSTPVKQEQKKLSEREETGHFFFFTSRMSLFLFCSTGVICHLITQLNDIDSLHVSSSPFLDVLYLRKQTIQ